MLKAKEKAKSSIGMHIGPSRHKEVHSHRLWAKIRSKTSEFAIFGVAPAENDSWRIRDLRTRGQPFPTLGGELLSFKQIRFSPTDKHNIKVQ